MRNLTITLTILLTLCLCATAMAQEKSLQEAINKGDVSKVKAEPITIETLCQDPTRANMMNLNGDDGRPERPKVGFKSAYRSKGIKRVKVRKVKR